MLSLFHEMAKDHVRLYGGLGLRIRSWQPCLIAVKKVIVHLLRAVPSCFLLPPVTEAHEFRPELRMEFYRKRFDNVDLSRHELALFQ